MFIKTLRHKGNTIFKLLHYMVDGMTDKEKDFLYAHNLPLDTLSSMTAAFLENDHYRSKQAKVRWYHEVLSFSPKDREHITDALLADISHKYIERRNPRALCFAVAHKETEHIHLHFCFSGTEYKSKKTLRMDDRVFMDIRLGMEAYQQEMYPELRHSIAYSERSKARNNAVERDQNTRAQRAYQRQQRTEKPSEKEQYTSIAHECYDRATSKQQFYELLQEQGLTLYMYRNKIAGVQGTRKYRFSTLGIGKEQLATLKRLADRYAEIATLRNEDSERER